MTKTKSCFKYNQLFIPKTTIQNIERVPIEKPEILKKAMAVQEM